jgi:hypothetical protein
MPAARPHAIKAAFLLFFPLLLAGDGAFFAPKAALCSNLASPPSVICHDA